MAANKAQQATTAERRTKAIKLRLAGLDWQEIADRLEYSSRGSACADVSRALEQHRKEEATAVEELRQTEALRLDRLMAGLWPKAAAGNVRAAEAALKVIDRRCKLWGLDMRSAAETDPSTALSLIGNIMTAITAAAAPDEGMEAEVAVAQIEETYTPQPRPSDF